MAEKKNQKVEDLSDLLDLTTDESTGAEEVISDGTPVSDPDAADFESILAENEDDREDAEIERLKAELAKPMPKPDEPSAKQKQIQELRDQLAQRRAQELSFMPPSYDEMAEGDESIVIHILADGFTVQGEVFYRGQEIVFPIHGKAYEQTKNRHGKTWLDLRNDDNAQYERWGKVYFHEGPWPFKSWDQLTVRDLPEGASEADLAKAIKAERSRRRLAPVLPGN